jgi:23S rRNA U2552 (ribose-2'-O)-methylase RlmE/FtsJ
MLYRFNIEKQMQVNLNVNIKSSDIPETPKHEYGYNTKLNICRNKIDNIDADNWKKVRWYINVYDFQVKDPIINRAFYKYWEIVNEFEIFEDYNDKELILHCAEAPGGFIQGTNIYLQIERLSQSVERKTVEVDKDGFTIVKSRKKNTRSDYKIYTISLNKELPQYKNYNLPSYNKNILNKYLCITYGKDQTGDINNLSNIDYIGSMSKMPFYLITADGGFDEGTDFNHKEQLHYNLILSEVYSAIQLQKQDGHFILKVFDILTETSIHLLYLLTLCYKEVYIYKPKTSRPTNSEKYIVCKYFNLPEVQRTVYVNQLKKLSDDIKLVTNKFISFTLFNTISFEFLNQIKSINTSLLDKQCSHLETAIHLCNDKTFIANYDIKLSESLEKRKSIFKEWENTYSLNSYV